MPASKFRRNRLILAQDKLSERLVIATNQIAIPVGYTYHYFFWGSYDDITILAERISNETPGGSYMMKKFVRNITPLADDGNPGDLTLFGSCYDSDLKIDDNLPEDLPVDKYRAPPAKDAIKMHDHDFDISRVYVRMCRQQRQLDLGRN